MQQQQTRPDPALTTACLWHLTVPCVAGMQPECIALYMIFDGIKISTPPSLSHLLSEQHSP